MPGYTPGCISMKPRRGSPKQQRALFIPGEEIARGTKLSIERGGPAAPRPNNYRPCTVRKNNCRLTRSDRLSICRSTRTCIPHERHTLFPGTDTTLEMIAGASDDDDRLSSHAKRQCRGRESAARRRAEPSRAASPGKPDAVYSVCAEHTHATTVVRVRFCAAASVHWTLPLSFFLPPSPPPPPPLALSLALVGSRA